jgi:hypothetical protein
MSSGIPGAYLPLTSAVPGRPKTGNRDQSALKELPRHHHPLDLVGAIVDLGDRGPDGGFRR